MTTEYFIGIDIGTQGARVLMLDDKGNEMGAADKVFQLSNQSREEQSPEEWWSTCEKLLEELCKKAAAQIDLKNVKAISVTSTSGTIIPLDRNNQPLHPAIMYSDGRSSEQAVTCKEAAIRAQYPGFLNFNNSCGLPKMLWYLENFPGQTAKIGKFIHAADFIIGNLSGNFSKTDYTSAFKSGYDIQKFSWPSYITHAIGIQREWLQDVLAPGTPVGEIRQTLAKKLGLPATVIITAGMTDGCASQVAAGAVNLGDWNTTIGTTMVIKGVTNTEIKDDTGAIYCHRHPEGYWMPGGASNTGADWVSRLFPGADLQELNREAANYIPTGRAGWPLLQDGERFPFVSKNARGFAPEGLSTALLFAVYMEGVAYLERYAFEKIKKLSGEKIERVFTAGGGSNSDLWLRIRSSVLNLPLYKMKNVSGAAGAAVLAASKTRYNSITEAAQSMIQPEKIIQPDIQLVSEYEKGYGNFIQQLKDRGYITE
jgi:sugar (pentulose or hexulose) kinase